MIRDYRGKRVDNGEWVEGRYVVLEGVHFIVTDKARLSIEYTQSIEVGFPRLEGSFIVQPESVGQWTGYYDRLGELQGKKKWYNGEILGGFHVPLVVLWHNSAFRCYEDLLAQKYVFDLPSTIDCYSIGNVTDDPKLLEAKNE